ncbi:Uncharacterised protein [Pantoea agglomerans]|uniref:Uncharacterized protein n=1 Tax=Enterobacter agglomerans TaxID=549 RepID=A0A379AHC7_ENTAG|nr:Uncharacterised protein [Pantoea agglomerans]
MMQEQQKSHSDLAPEASHQNVLVAAANPPD